MLSDLPLNQPYSSSVAVGGILSIGPVVSHTNEGSLTIPDVPPISVENVDKSFLLKNLKLSYTTRTYDSMTLSDIPGFLTELSELRKSVHSSVRIDCIC